MSDHSHTPELEADYISKQKTRMPGIILGVVGVIGLIVSFALGLGDGRQFAFSWLFALLYFFTIAVGALFWVFVHHATDAEWSVVVRRLLENLGLLIPITGVIFFAGIIFAAPLLFKWWDIPPGVDHLLDHKRGYLNHTAFYIRAIFYFGALSLLAYLVRRNSVQQDTDGKAVHTLRNRVLSFIGIPVLGLSLTFAAVDWLMALEHHWFSTMWGVYVFAGGVGSALGLLVLILTALRRTGHLSLVNMEHYHIVGKLMLAFCVFWAYIGFSQYMLIWYANIPEETSYFLRRNTETWWYFSMVLVIGRFFLPFPILLFQATKKNPKYLCLVAAWLLIMQALDLYVIILPMLHVRGASVSFLDITNLVAIGGILGAAFFWLLPRTSLYPVRDPRIQESIRLSN